MSAIKYKEPDPNKWFNLDTGRQIATRSNKPDFWFVAEPRVAGTKANLEKFFQDRSEPLPELYKQPPKEGKPAKKKSEVKSEVKSESKREVKSEVNANEGLSLEANKPSTAKSILSKLNIKPSASDLGKQITTSVLSAIPAVSIAARTILDVAVTSPVVIRGTKFGDDIRRIPKETLDKLSIFTVNGQKGYARMMRVIDGDTYDIACYLTLRGLQTSINENRRFAGNQAILTDNPDAGFFTRLITRLEGIDTAEKNTIQGQLAKHLVINFATENKDFVYVELHEDEKYGRTMVSIYNNADKTINLKDLLLKYRHPRYGKVAEEYFGGTKSEWTKSLPTYHIVGGKLVDENKQEFPIEQWFKEGA